MLIHIMSTGNEANNEKLMEKRNFQGKAAFPVDTMRQPVEKYITEHYRIETSRSGLLREVRS